MSATGPPIAAPPAPPSVLKDALAKRATTLPDQLENNHHESNGTVSKLSNSVSVDASKPPSSAPPPTPAPPVPTSAPPGGPPPLRSTENIIKVRMSPPPCLNWLAHLSKHSPNSVSSEHALMFPLPALYTVPFRMFTTDFFSGAKLANHLQCY